MAGNNRRKKFPCLSKSSSDVNKHLKGVMKELRNFHAIMDRSPAVVFLWKVEEGWPVEYVSNSVNQFGDSADDFISGRVSWVGVTHPDDVPRLESEIEHYSKEGIQDFSQEYRLITRRGDIRWIEDRTMAIINSKGNVTH
jgi:PAS domain S-box-containing protein